MADLKDAPLWLQGHGEMAGVVLYASLFEPDVARLDLWHPPTTHRQGPARPDELGQPLRVGAAGLCLHSGQIAEDAQQFGGVLGVAERAAPVEPLQAALGLDHHGRVKQLPQLHPADINALLVHPWPGNVRELKAAADRFALGLDATGRSLDTILGPRAKPISSTASLADRVAAYERHVIEAELARHNDSIAAVVDALQVPRRTLSEKMARLGVRR